MIARGRTVHALVRPGSEDKVPAGANRVLGNALEANTSVDRIPATILRPWYVLGPVHRRPWALMPFYAIFRAIPSTRAAARRLGPVPLHAMVAALAQAVATTPDSGVRIVEVPEILALARADTAP